MLRRSLVVTLVTALTLGAAAAAQAGPAHVEGPIEADQVEVEAEGGDVVLNKGTASVAASARSGSFVVWEKRTPCFEQDPNSCLPDRSETSRTSDQFQAASITVTPREQGHTSLIRAPDTASVSLASEQAQVTVRPNARTVSLSDDSDAPRDLARAELDKGVDANASAGDLNVEGPFAVQTVGSIVEIQTNASDETHSFQTGLTWEREDGFYYKTLRLLKVSADGGLTAAWDGPLLVHPTLPAGLNAEKAVVNVTQGQLGEANASTGPTEIEGLEATISGVAWEEDSGDMIVEQGAQPVADADPNPDGEGVSRTEVVGFGSAAAVTVLLAAYYWPRLSWLGAVTVLPLYSRIEKEDLFENEVREELYETIKDDPGIHAHALSEEADIGWGTTVYHLRRLERNGFVNSEKRGRYRRFFPAQGFMERQREVLSVLQNDTTNDIARLVLDEPGLNQSAICDELDISPSLANWHLNRLIDAELVDRERRGRTVHYTPGPAWEALETAADLEPGEVLGDVQAA